MQGQLFDFETSLRVIGSNGKQKATAKEEQQPKYNHEGNKQLVATNIDSLYFNEQIEDIKPGSAKVTINLTAHEDTSLSGIYFVVKLPKAEYVRGTVKLNSTSHSINTFKANRQNLFIQGTAKEIEVKSAERQFKLVFDIPTVVALRKDTSKNSGDYLLYVHMAPGHLRQGQSIVKTYVITASGKIDTTPIELNVNTRQTGRPFAGFGGNFRLQNPKTDPQVIDYSLQNMRVAWSRVEMPWRFWQPQMNVDPTQSAQNGGLNPAVQKAMEMAQRLNQMNIPVILTAWSAPDWAVAGPVHFRHKPGEVWGNPLDYTHLNAVYKSIADYIVYLHTHYGVDVKLFSFNESDLGINIRLSGLQHAVLIKTLGAYFKSRGLKTKLLLGDNSDATTYNFIYPAINDPATHPYIGAVSFHSWRGWDTYILQQWANAAKQLNVPLIVGEGSIDAAAWNYPAIFEEPTYAREEINLYTRMLAICQPLTILQWQLTADYSPLIGGGIFGNNGPLMPTQRFWNLKQLASTPENVFAMPISVNRADVSVAALGNNTTHTYAIHLVNNGSTRKVTLHGLPTASTKATMYLTNQQQQMQESTINVTNGTLHFDAKSTSYITIIVKE